MGFDKEPSLKAQLELLTTNINVLEMRQQRVPDVDQKAWRDHRLLNEDDSERRRNHGNDRYTDGGIGPGWSRTSSESYRSYESRNAGSHCTVVVSHSLTKC